jgi:hypothetical protein
LGTDQFGQMGHVSDEIWEGGNFDEALKKEGIGQDQ